MDSEQCEHKRLLIT